MENGTLHNSVSNGSARRNSFDSSGSRNLEVLRNRLGTFDFWRPSSLVNLMSNTRRQRVLQSFPSRESIGSISTECAPIFYDKDQDACSQVKESNKRGWTTIVTVVLVEAKDLPDPVTDGSSHSIYCKIRLGSENYKSKPVASTHRPKWKERLSLHLNKYHLLRLSLWDKGKNVNFMGSCVIDLSKLVKERTHELWQSLDDGFGSIHLNVTMCAIKNKTLTSEGVENLNDVKDKFAISNLASDWKVVGQLYVRLVEARGLIGKPSAYCTLELDNERVQTHSCRASEPLWNKTYMFNVYDVTSTLDLKVCYSSIVNSLIMEYLGKVSIPLLRIQNGEMRWYALKDRNQRNSAKGNCPRVLLEMNLIWNPVKATIKLFQSKEVKYIKKLPKFDIALIHSNLEFIRDTLNFLYELNESYKRFLEWDNIEMSSLALIVWLLFWYHFELWTAPLFLLLPFMYFWFFYQQNQYFNLNARHLNKIEEELHQNDSEKIDKGITGKIQGLPELTLSITNAIEYIASLAERMYNLVTFKVPFLSYLAMVFLGISSVGLYLIPFRYLLMALGIYKYMRKYLNPDRTPNNDFLDFISRIPDNEILKDWKELSVPEPNLHRNS